MKQSTILEVKNFRAQFLTENEPIVAVDGVDLTVEAGQIVGIVGESGSGKSVLCQSILRLLDYDDQLDYSGDIFFENQDIFDLSKQALRALRGNRISMIFQDPMSSLNPLYTIGNQIREVLIHHKGLKKRQAQARAIELLTLVGIPEPVRLLKQYPHELSGGMQQRVMIVMALACEPDILIADEATTALDVTIQKQIVDLLLELNQQLGMAIIFVSHDLAVVSQLCSKVYVMQQGKVIETADTETLFTQPQHPYTQQLIQAASLTE